MTNLWVGRVGSAFVTLGMASLLGCSASVSETPDVRGSALAQTEAEESAPEATGDDAVTGTTEQPPREEQASVPTFARCAGVEFVEGFGRVERAWAVALRASPSGSATIYRLDRVALADDGLSLTFGAVQGFVSFEGELRARERDGASIVDGALTFVDFDGSKARSELAPVRLSGEVAIGSESTQAGVLGSPESTFVWQLVCSAGRPLDL